MQKKHGRTEELASTRLHAELLAEVDGALVAFRDAMVEHGRWDQVLVMT